MRAASVALVFGMVAVSRAQPPAVTDPIICCQAVPTCPSGYYEAGLGAQCGADEKDCLVEELCCKAITCRKSVEECTLSCGTTVRVGWEGKGEGTNSCNDCRCTAAGLSCTEKACLDAEPCATPTPVTRPPICCQAVPTCPSGYYEAGLGAQCGADEKDCLVEELCCKAITCRKSVEECTLSCGTTVRVGWEGKGEGTNSCNDCRCTAAGLSCTEKACIDAEPCATPVPEPTPCTGDVCRAGYEPVGSLRCPSWAAARGWCHTVSTCVPHVHCWLA